LYEEEEGEILRVTRSSEIKRSGNERAEENVEKENTRTSACFIREVQKGLDYPESNAGSR